MNILKKQLLRSWQRKKVRRLLPAILLMLSVSASADTISNNLSSTSAGTEAATGDTWLATSFTTSSSTSLTSVTLSVGDLTSSNAAAQLALYTDDGLNEPGTELGTLTAGSSYSSTLSNVTYSANNLTLSTDSTYWLVLNTTSGELDWSYAADDSGTGTGFTDAYAESYDAGSTWYTYASNQDAGVYPLQADVESSAASTTASAVPESGTASLLLIAALALFPFAFRRLRSSKLAIQ